ncbi:sugar ABC transporter substrate-binding protein [Nonomuraea sp. NN258]|uniref:ABC transporter substrate-binding protein n=1 Tax=Nonomuraea antri TaxID=2730852 RepID=UPI0015695221|nr:sugar ABC transporter substrate-binding protein [Nonomuraea antri]NRQ37162.1 sugar ABC transporter substrate-binding protein [Nonomuraea antri]
MRIKSALAVAAVAVLATACGSGGGGGEKAAEPGKPVTIKFLSLAWQKESIAANKEIVDAWNKANPNLQVTLVQGSWDNANDQLVTQFAGGTAPDVIHNDSPALSGFASDGYLLDLTDKLPAELKSDIPQAAWDTVTFKGKSADGIYGVPFLQESQVVIANKKLLDAAKVRVPTSDNPWTWDEFAEASKKMTKDGTYGVAWPMKSPVNKSLNMALNFGGTFFQTGADGKTTVKVGPEEREVLQRIHDQLYKDKSADPAALGQGTADPLPAFYDGKFALLPAGVYLRQQVAEQAPDGFEWVTLPPLKGTTSEQGAVSQTLSIAQDSKYADESMKFISFFLNAENQAKLAKGDWLLPTSQKAAADPAMTAQENGWDVATASAKNLVVAPFLKVNGFDEWKSKVATPALQEYFGNKITLDEAAKRLVEDGNKVLERYQQ